MTRFTASLRQAWENTFFCDLSWCVDPWRAPEPSNLVPPAGHKNAGDTGVPEGCPLTRFVPDPASGKYEGADAIKLRWLGQPIPVGSKLIKQTGAEKTREIWVMMLWRSRYGNSRWGR